MGLDGTGMRKLSGPLDRDARNLRWARNGAGVYFTAEDRGTSNIRFASVSGMMREVTTGVHMLALSGSSSKDIGVGVRSTAHQPPDVVRVNLAHAGTITQLTRVNEDLLAGVTLRRTSSCRTADVAASCSRA